MDFSSTTGACRDLRCAADINGQCPNELRAPGGCNNPCTVFKTNQYCCTDGPGSCGPTDFSRFFKEWCPDAYSYPQDDPTSLFTCPSARAGRFSIINNCPYTVWAGAVPGGGRQLNARNGTWSLDVSPSTTTGRIWPRTGCIFDGSGRGRCETVTVAASPMPSLWCTAEHPCRIRTKP
ncbi:Pathogenesis-related protein R major form [Morella rubra]|uniref:Pathogenesis-related protein R major form n=1 Tax=Morella rubra TaxID=262757 RepID=A0A6A1VRQ3_9ROSI|nr:Pathogenesis-related protein R major form [Morella rubra]